MSHLTEADELRQEIQLMNWQGSVTRIFVVRSASAISALGYVLLLASVLTPDAMGEFTVTLSVAIIAATIAKFGLDTYVMREAASSPGESRQVTLYCLCAAGFGGLFVWGLLWMGFTFYSATSVVFVVLLSGIPFLAMIYVLAGLLKSGNLPATAVFLETGCWQTVLCLCAIIMHLAGYNSVLLVAVCFSAGLALIFVVSFFLSWQRVLNTGAGNQKALSVTGADFQELAAMAGLTISHVIMRWSDTLWLVWWLDPSEIAVYVICTRLAGGITFIDHAVNAVAAPRFAHFFTRKNTIALGRELRHACVMSGAWGAVGAVVVILIGPLLLDWLGSPYSEASIILLLVAVTTAVQVMMMPIGHYATMTGQASVHFKAAVTALAVQQLVYLIFIPVYGVMAALFGFALSRILSCLIILVVLRHRGLVG